MNGLRVALKNIFLKIVFIFRSIRCVENDLKFMFLLNNKNIGLSSVLNRRRVLTKI